MVEVNEGEMALARAWRRDALSGVFTLAGCVLALLEVSRLQLCLD